MPILAMLAAMAAGVLPHLPNFTPVFGAMLYGGARLRGRGALWLPFVLMAGLYAVQAEWIYHSHLGWGIVWTPLAMAPMVAAGGLLRRRAGWMRLGAAALAGATGFYLLDNFLVWCAGAMYPHSLAGLAACYAAAVPFYGNSILAGMLFGGFLLAADEYAARRRTGLAAGVRP